MKPASDLRSRKASHSFHASAAEGLARSHVSREERQFAAAWSECVSEGFISQLPCNLAG